MPGDIARVTWTDRDGQKCYATLGDKGWRGSLGVGFDDILNSLYLPRSYSPADGQIGAACAQSVASWLGGTVEFLTPPVDPARVY